MGNTSSPGYVLLVFSREASHTEKARKREANTTSKQGRAERITQERHDGGGGGNGSDGANDGGNGFDGGIGSVGGRQRGRSTPAPTCIYWRRKSNVWVGRADMSEGNI